MARVAVGSSMMQRNSERVAWLVILGAFAAFLLLCATVPLGIRYYLRHATSPKTATLDVIGGTIGVRERGAPAPIAVTKTVQLSEGSTLETYENSRGILTFYDGSTAILFPSTQIVLREMHVSTFPWGVEPITLEIEETRGRLRVGAASLVPQTSVDVPARDLEILTPQLTAALAEGSYAIEVGTDASQVIVTDGNAAVTAQERTVNVGRRERTVATQGQPPLPPMPAAQDIIVNGDFSDPLPRGWDNVHEPSNDPNVPLGNVALETLGDRHAVNITRSGSNQTSANTGIIQQIGKEVSDYRSVQLLADIRVHFQSLSGGGVLSSEYPLILRLRYRDVYGSEAEWVHGFYVQNLTNNPTNNGEQVPADVWVPFESGNLYETLDPKPFFITSLQIYASGWDYDSYVSGVRLVVE
jgi:hypothetical protein